MSATPPTSPMTFLRRYAAVVLIAVVWVAVLAVGLLAREPMLGDEVTHYYMLVTQAGNLPMPSVCAEIPVACSDVPVERRFYPHVFLWHYVGAIVWTALGKTMSVVQVYHSLFLLQLLFFGWLLVRHETSGRQPAAEYLYVVMIASLPLVLLFSVAFYLDVPATAQLLAALFFLRRRRLMASLVFLFVGLCIKETVVAMAPAYLLCVWFFYRPLETRLRAGVRVLFVVAVLLAHTWLAVQVFNKLGFEYHPYYAFRGQVLAVSHRVWSRLMPTASVVPRVASPVIPDAASSVIAPPLVAPVPQTSPLPMEEKHYTPISVSPGDLRRPLNWVMYGGGVLWVMVAAGIVGLLWRSLHRRAPLGNPPAAVGPSSDWMVWTGLWYLAFVGLQMRTAPDARFFLPGIILLLLPLVRWALQLPGVRVWLPLVCMVGLLQGGLVLAKARELRMVRPGVLEAIAYLTEHRPTPNTVFMYPEGNYRLFPCRHDWYLKFALRDFWRADNDARIRLLQRRRMGAIVIKKYLVAPIDPAMNNLGVYPDFFVEQIGQDPRFCKLFENGDVVIYQIPVPDDSATRDKP